MFTKIRRSFTLQVYCFAAVIALVCMLLMILTWLQGPRIRSSTIDTSLATTAANQQLILHMNQAPGAISKKLVKISPNIAFDVTSSGNTVAIQFTQPLQNDTDYAVKIQTPDKRYTVTHTFRTPPAVFYFAVSNDQTTEIRRQIVGTPKSDVVYSGGKVSDYLVLGNTLVLSLKEDDKTRVTLFDIATKQYRDITLPGKGSVSQLHGAPGKRVFGFLYTDYDNDIYGNILLYGINAQELRRVGFSKGRTLEAGEWQLARNGETVLAQTLDSSALLLSPDIAPIPLGQYSELFGFSHDDSSIVLRKTNEGVVRLNVTDMQAAPVLTLDSKTYVADALPLFTRPGNVLQIQTSANGPPAQKVIINRENKLQEVYTNESVEEYITALALSSNDQFIAIEERPIATDEYRNRIINSTTGDTLAEVDGTMLRWPTGL
jgi:hypothetical protein